MANHQRAGLGPHQLRPRAVRVGAADHLGEGGAGGCAAQVEIVEGGAQFEEGRALAAGKLARGGDIGYIKPDNVLLNDYGEPVLSDFGLAHISGGFKTASGVFTGSITYTAPEVLAGSPPTVAADVYSLGAMLHALLAGTAAYERNSGEDLLAHFQRVSSRAIPDLCPAGVPDAVCTAIERAMALDPAKRPAPADRRGPPIRLRRRSSQGSTHRQARGAAMTATIPLHLY